MFSLVSPAVYVPDRIANAMDSIQNCVIAHTLPNGKDREVSISCNLVIPNHVTQ